MMNKVKNIFAIILIIISFLGIIALTLYASSKLYYESIEQPEDVRFVVDSEVALLVGEKHQLTPYLINENNQVEYGQYLYSSNNDLVKVDENGVVHALGIPEGECYIEVKEMARNITTKILVTVSKGINKVFNIEEINGTDMFHDASYEFKVTFLPEGTDVADYFSYKVINKENEEVGNVFDVEVKGNTISFSTIGLGSGSLSIQIKSEKDFVDYSKNFDFDIKLENEILTNDIINGKLLNKDELDKITRVDYSGEEINIKDLIFLPQLKDIVFVNDDKLCEIHNLSDQYQYHVKDNLYLQYHELSAENINFFDYVKPYNTSIEEDKYVIFDNDGDLSCVQVASDFALKDVTKTGYNHMGWSLSKEDVKVETLDDINSSSDKCIVLYSVYEPINYKLEYYTSAGLLLDVLGKPSEEYTYEDSFNIKGYDSFTNYFEQEIIKESKKGYKFIGWTFDATETLVLKTEEEIKEKVQYNFRDNETILQETPLTEVDNEVIKLYDVWQPITYKVSFDVTGYEKEFISSPEDITCFYGDTVTIPKPDLVGYKLNGWNFNEDIIVEIKNLSTVENDTVVLSPSLEAKLYTIQVRIPAVESGKRIISLNTTSYDYYKATISYDQELLGYTKWEKIDSIGNKVDNEEHTIDTLPIFPGNGYKNYLWYLDASNKDENYLKNSLYDKEFEPSCSSKDENIDYRRKIYLRDFIAENNCGDYFVALLKEYESLPVDERYYSLNVCGLANSFTIEYDLKGATLFNNSEQVLLNDGTYDSNSYKVYVTEIKKYGYDFNGWTIKRENADSGVEEKTITLENISGLDYKLSIVNGKICGEAFTIKDGDHITIEPILTPKVTTISFDLNGGEFAGATTIDSKTKTFGDNIENDIPQSNLTKTGYSFVHWVDNTGMVFDSSNGMPGVDTTLKAIWKANAYTISFEEYYDTEIKFTYTTYNASGKEEVVTETVKAPASSTKLSVVYGTNVKISVTYVNSQDRYYKIMNGTKEVTVSSNSFTMPAGNLVVSADSNPTPGCFVRGTKILMGDGSYKNIEDIEKGDLVATWNFFEGKYEVQPVIFYWNHESVMVDIIELEFSNGNNVEIITSHGFFDMSKKEFVQITAENYMEFIGHEFATVNVNGEAGIATLLSANIRQIEDESYSLATAFNANAIAYEMLTITYEDYEGIYSLKFEVDDNMKFIEENIQYYIDLYGLYTYEEWAEYLTIEQFYAINGQYFKILIGRGFLTLEDIFTLLAGMAEL